MEPAHGPDRHIAMRRTPRHLARRGRRNAPGREGQREDMAGLCHIWPELGNQRLYRVPVTMGWRDTPLQEAELNPQALYV